MVSGIALDLDFVSNHFHVGCFGVSLVDAELQWRHLAVVYFHILLLKLPMRFSFAQTNEGILGWRENRRGNEIVIHLLSLQIRTQRVSFVLYGYRM